MLTHLQLKNFKGWKDTGKIEMAPLTVFFGTNSSGKSSIEQFLLMLKQTVDSSDRRLVVFPGDKNTPVNLGSFEELVYDRDPRNKLEFEFGWQLPERLKVEDTLSGYEAEGNEITFSAAVGMVGKLHSTLAVDHFDYKLRDKGIDQLKVQVERKEPNKAEYQLTADSYALVRTQGRAWPLGAPTKFYGFPDQIAKYFQNADFVQDFSLEMERLLRSISYLGPLRSKGERLYYWTGGEPENVGYSGENTISALLAAKGRKLNLQARQTKLPFEQFIAQRLKNLELIEEFRVQQVAPNRKEYEVKVRTPGSSAWVDLPDVGFGISQVLPVIVQCFYAPIGSILFIEQPELHLHPRAQANLADLFIDVLNAREDGKDRRIQLIVETHSEHLLTRLQRRIAERNDTRPIQSENVAAYFAHTTGNESKLEALQIDEYGSILNWPENFFGDSMNDIVEKTKAEAYRRQAAELIVQ